jgi:hypothetical protein
MFAQVLRTRTYLGINKKKEEKAGCLLQQTVLLYKVHGLPTAD